MAAAKKVAVEEEKIISSPPAPAPVTINIENNSPTPRRAKAQPRAAPDPEPEPDDDDQQIMSFNDDEEADELTQFIEAWSDGKQYQMTLARHPDTSEMEGRWLKLCTETEYYPRFPFRPDSLVQDIQRRTKSGGKVRIQLHDRNGYVQGGSLTFIVSDPDPALLAANEAKPVVAPAITAAAREATENNDVVNKAIQAAIAARITKLFDDPPPAGNPAPAAKPELSSQDKLSLALIQESKLLPTVFGQITQAIAAANQNVNTAPDKFDKVLSIFERIPSLHSRAAKTIDRLLNRFLPDEGGTDTDDAEEEEMTTEERRQELLTYLMNRCAANQPVTFRDEEIASFIAAEPDEWNELLVSLQLGSVEQIIHAMTQPAVSSKLAPTLAIVLRSEHAHQWVQSIKDLALAEKKNLA
jgi:hypothetical protein